MSRVKLSEFKAKSLLVGEGYTGVAIEAGKPIPAFPMDARLVLKVDQGIKKRMKQGLVAVGISPAEIPVFIEEWSKKGFSHFIAEPLLPHEESEERYFSLERVREGIRLLYAKEGGIDIEEHPEKVLRLTVTDSNNVHALAEETGLPASFLETCLSAFNRYECAFLEINPLVIQGDKVHLLDAAVLVDSAGEFFVKGAWTEDDVREKAAAHDSENVIRDLQKTTPASLKLTVLNPNGSLFFLLSGGGGSIVAADEAALLGAGAEIGNYGEYSGGPTREETYLYAKEVINLMLSAKPESGKRALIIAGGVANFTDIKKTFAGIIDALSERKEEIKAAGVRVFVRRGGPNEAAGLAHMQAFLESAGILGSVHGSDEPITTAIDEAVAYTRS